MAIAKARRAFLKEQCRLFAAGVVEELEVIASSRFDHLGLSDEEVAVLENEKHAIADRIWNNRRNPTPQPRAWGLKPLEWKRYKSLIGYRLCASDPFGNEIGRIDLKPDVTDEKIEAYKAEVWASYQAIMLSSFNNGDDNA